MNHNPTSPRETVVPEIVQAFDRMEALAIGARSRIETYPADERDSVLWNLCDQLAELAADRAALRDLSAWLAAQGRA